MDERLLSQGADRIAAVLRYDSIWTGYAQDPSFAAHHPLDVIKVAQGFRDAIQATQPAVIAIADAIENSGDLYRYPPQSLLKLLAADASVAVVVKVIEAYDNDLLAMARDAADHFDTNVVEEAEQLLAEDLTKMLAGAVAVGSLSKRFLCWAAQAAMAAAAATAAFPPHLHAAALAGVGASIYNNAGCGGSERARA